MFGGGRVIGLREWIKWSSEVSRVRSINRVAWPVIRSNRQSSKMSWNVRRDELAGVRAAPQKRRCIEEVEGQSSQVDLSIIENWRHRSASRYRRRLSLETEENPLDINYKFTFFSLCFRETTRISTLYVQKRAFRRKLWQRGTFSRFRPTTFRLRNLLFHFQSLHSKGVASLKEAEGHQLLAKGYSGGCGRVSLPLREFGGRELLKKICVLVHSWLKKNGPRRGC